MSTLSTARTALILAQHVKDQEWAYDLRIRDGLSWHAMRARAILPRDMGGLGRDPGIPALKGYVAEYRAAQGEIVGTREERIERRQLELDALALIARDSLSRAATPVTIENEHGEVIELPPRLDEKAAKVLLDARAAEAKMHGDDAAQRVELEVTTHTQLDAEIDAALERMDALDAAEQEG